MADKFRWSDEDTQYLIDKYPTTDTRALAVHFGTSYISVKNKLANLKKHGIVLEKDSDFMAVLRKEQVAHVHNWWRTDTEEKNRQKRVKQHQTITDKLNDVYQLSESQIQVMLGSVIGNGSMRRAYNQCIDPYPYITFTQGWRFEGYLRWKYQIFESLAQDQGVHKLEYNKTTFGKGGYYRFSTRCLPCFSKYYAILRPDDSGRAVSREWIDQIDMDNPLALAVFYMDVGTLRQQSQVINKSGEVREYNRVSMSLGTKTMREGKLICGWIKKATGVDARLNICAFKDGRKDELRLNIAVQADVKAFVNFVSPVIKEIPCMAHLIDLF